MSTNEPMAIPCSGPLRARREVDALVTANRVLVMEYDLDNRPVQGREHAMYQERFIHGEIYKARPDVNAIVHSQGKRPAAVLTRISTGYSLLRPTAAMYGVPPAPLG